MQQLKPRDDIDAVVENLMLNPQLAETLRHRLNQRANEGETLQQRRARLRLLTVCSDAESLWDNVPV